MIGWIAILTFRNRDKQYYGPFANAEDAMAYGRLCRDAANQTGKNLIADYTAARLIAPAK